MTHEKKIRDLMRQETDREHTYASPDGGRFLMVIATCRLGGAGLHYLGRIHNAVPTGEIGAYGMGAVRAEQPAAVPVYEHALGWCEGWMAAYLALEDGAARAALTYESWRLESQRKRG